MNPGDSPFDATPGRAARRAWQRLADPHRAGRTDCTATGGGLFPIGYPTHHLLARLALPVILFAAVLILTGRP